MMRRAGLSTIVHNADNSKGRWRWRCIWWALNHFVRCKECQVCQEPDSCLQPGYPRQTCAIFFIVQKDKKLILVQTNVQCKLCCAVYMEFCAVCGVQLFSDHDQTSLINISKGQTLCDRKIHQCCFIAHGACNHHGGSGWRGRGVLVSSKLLLENLNCYLKCTCLRLPAFE